MILLERAVNLHAYERKISKINSYLTKMYFNFKEAVKQNKIFFAHLLSRLITP